MLLLALDTSTSTASVALFDGQRVLSETTWLAGREHSSRLLVEIDSALERAQRTPEELTGLVVACGPGSFTGVRVALSVAKGMAAGLGVPLWGIGTLDVVAHAADGVDVPVLAVLEAGRGRFASALYVDGRQAAPARLLTLDQLEAAIATATLVAGELNHEARERLGRQPTVRLQSRAASARRAGILAQLGWRQARSGDPGDPLSVDAVYLS